MPLLLLTLAAALAVTAAATSASAHVNPCHPKHDCPSDHASYRWQGWLCVKPGAAERSPAFRKRIVYARLVYWCHR